MLGVMTGHHLERCELPGWENVKLRHQVCLVDHIFDQLQDKPGKIR